MCHEALSTLLGIVLGIAHTLLQEHEVPTFVYVLCCRDGSYYVGTMRERLEARVAEHNAGRLSDYTSRRRPVELVWQQAFDRIADAVEAERKPKGWSRAKKEALIQGRYDLLGPLARRRTDHNARR